MRATTHRAHDLQDRVDVPPLVGRVPTQREEPSAYNTKRIQQPMRRSPRDTRFGNTGLPALKRAIAHKAGNNQREQSTENIRIVLLGDAAELRCEIGAELDRRRGEEGQQLLRQDLDVALVDERVDELDGAAADRDVGVLRGVF